MELLVHKQLGLQIQTTEMQDGGWLPRRCRKGTDTQFGFFDWSEEDPKAFKDFDAFMTAN